jgi:hypothetical protein
VSSTVCNITFDCADPSALARFWGQVTGLPVIEEPQPGYPESALGDSRPRLYFVKVPEGKIVKNRVHLDIMPDDRTQDEEIARLTGLGAATLDKLDDIGPLPGDITVRRLIREAWTLYRWQGRPASRP